MNCKKILSNVVGHRFQFLRNRTRNVNPFTKTLNVLKMDMPFISKEKGFAYPEHADIVIIGGGHIGSAIAYSLKSRAGDGLSVVVIEKDFTYEQARKNISLGTLTQHFSLAENVELAKYSMDFLRTAKEKLGENCDIQYTPTGSLVLASEEYAEKLEENVTMLNELGVKSKVLSITDINRKFPWINTKDVKLGCMAIEGEGTFDSWALLKGFIQKSQELGTTYVNAEVIGFELEKQKDVLMEGVEFGTYKRINKVIYKTDDNEEIGLKFAICVLAAGHNSTKIAEFAEIGKREGILKTPIPIEKRESNVYSVEEKAIKTGLCTPMIMDPTGLWLMRNGLSNNILCGHIPMMLDDTKDMSPDEFYNNTIKPSLLHRIPNCKDAEINKYITETHDCNTFDNSGIIGAHPYYNNLFFACGFGRLGCQHAPGIGRAISEYAIDSQFVNIDLTRFCFDRILTKEAVVDFNVY